MRDRGQLRCSAARKLVWLWSSTAERRQRLEEYKNPGRWRRSWSAERSVRGEEDWGGGSGENSSLTLSLSSGSVAAPGFILWGRLLSSHFCPTSFRLTRGIRRWKNGRARELSSSRPVLHHQKKKKKKRPWSWNQKKRNAAEKLQKSCWAAAFKFCTYDWFVN